MKKLLPLFTWLFMMQGLNAQNTWTEKADFRGGDREGAVGFSIGTKGYLGTGLTPYTYDVRKDFWEYDPSANTWTQKADFGGTARTEAVGFSIGGKGYIGTGSSGSGFNYVATNATKDFWEYNPVENTWTRKADVGGEARIGAVGFSIGSKGYIGTGHAKKDFWEYDTATDMWTRKADYAGGERYKAVGFSIGTKGYIGTGFGISRVTTNDFWEYDPTSNTWVQEANFPGGARYYATGFSIGTKGYIG